MSEPSTSLFGLRYVEKLNVPVVKEDEVRMSYPGDPRDTGLIDTVSQPDRTMRMSLWMDPRDTGYIDIV